MRNVLTEDMILRLYDTPYGCLRVGVSHGYLCLCEWLVQGGTIYDPFRHKNLLRSVDKQVNMPSASFSDEYVMNRVADFLGAYFSGKDVSYSLPLWMCGTSFQQDVWRVLLSIPYGSTLSYTALANAVGRPSAQRAVANACAANHLVIFIPCHRVVGMNGSLVGYVGGIRRKELLLSMETMRTY